LLQDLQKQAPLQGGQVILLLGNHEVMNLSGNYRDAHKSEKNEAGKKLKDQLYARGECSNVDEEKTNDIDQTKQKEETLGDFLRKLPMIANIQRTIFVHGG
jgi:hypothetical protein